MNHVGTLAALCAAAAALPAVAQTSAISIYGRLDLGITHQNSGTTNLNGGNGATGAAGKRWDVRQSSGNRLGFRGAEDLGRGWKAGFHIEHRFRADSGAADNPFWAARSIVELGSPYGAVYLGREYIPLFWTAVELDPWRFETTAMFGSRHQFAGYSIDGGVRSLNTVGYKSPNWGGFTAQLATALGEGARERSASANLQYKRGPWFFGGGFDRVDSNRRLALIGGAYDFGVVRPMLTFSRSTVAGIDARNLSVGATAPVGPGQLRVGFARYSPDGANNDIDKLGLGYVHPLSKRVSLHADIGSAKQEGRSRTTAVDAGIKYNF